MTDRVIIPLPGIGTLDLARDAYEAALRPIAAPQPATAAPPSATELVSAKTLAGKLSLPVSCLYQYAKEGRIPSVRVGRHVRFSASAVLAALSATGGVTGGHA